MSECNVYCCYASEPENYVYYPFSVYFYIIDFVSTLFYFYGDAHCMRFEMC